MIVQISPHFDDQFKPIKPCSFPRDKVNENIRNYDYLNIPSEYSPYRIRLPKLKVCNIKQRVVSYSEKLFPEKYNKKRVTYDDFSKMFISDPNIKKMDKNMVINRVQCKIVMAETEKRKTSEKFIKISK